MTWGPIDQDWGEGWEDFESDPFADRGDRQHRRRTSNVTRLPRVPHGNRGTRLDRALTGPRIREPQARRPSARPSSNPIAAARTPVLRQGSTPFAVPVPMPGGGGGRFDDGAQRLRAVGPPRPPLGGRRPPPPARPERRSLALKILLGLLLVAVVIKLVDIQMVEPDRLVERGEAQRLRTVPLPASRGRILDREGHELALSVERPSVFADPSQIVDPDDAARELAPVLDIPVAELVEKLSRDSRFVYLKRWVTDDLASAVTELDIDGIHLQEEPQRFTPSGDLARSLVGKVASDETGATGIEYLYDDVLTGTPGEVVFERSPDGKTIAAAGQTRVAPQPGADVVLTLDRSLQYEAERVLSEQVDALGAKGGMVVITTPATGEILAMANITRNTDEAIITAGANRAVVDVFEPGSVNKVITIAAALEEGLVEPDTQLLVPDRLQVSDHLFGDDHDHPTAPMSVTKILAESSNVGTIMLGQQLGKERIDRYLRSFGFGASTGLGFPNESRGLLLPTADWSGTSIGSIPIGQGIAVTAMQMLDAYNVIANDGLYVAPRLVAATVDGTGRRTPTAIGESHQVVSAETARAVREMLVEAVESGTGERAKVPGYRVGGKTGTARKPQPTGGYRDAAGNFQYVAAFTGMVPAEDPELSIIVVIDEPSATIYGGSAAAPVFADLASFALHRFRIPPTAR